MAALGACTQQDSRTTSGGIAGAAATSASAATSTSAGTGVAAGTRALRDKVDTIVVIYAENRAFDSL
jgi:phospholipase C